jgi:hypothetical protein
MHNVRLHYSKKTCVVAKMHGQWVLRYASSRWTF